MPTDMDSVLKARIGKLLSESKKSAAAVSKEATGKPDVIRDIMRKNIIPAADKLQKIADVFDVDVAYLTGRSNVRRPQGAKTTHGLIPVRMVGSTQAGAFMEVAATNPYDDDPRWIAAVRDDEFPDLEPIAFEVIGDSIDKICQSGGYAICVPFADTGLQIKDKMWVIAERQSGHLVERTVKQVRKNGNGFELHPFSTNKEWKPIQFQAHDGHDHEEVRVVALVRRFIGPALPA